MAKGKISREETRKCFFEKGTKEFVFRGYIWTYEGIGREIKVRMNENVKVSVVPRRIAELLQLPCLKNETYHLKVNGKILPINPALANLELRADFGTSIHFNDAVVAVADIPGETALILGKEELKKLKITFKETEDEIVVKIKEVTPKR